MSLCTMRRQVRIKLAAVDAIGPTIEILTFGPDIFMLTDPGGMPDKAKL